MALRTTTTRRDQVLQVLRDHEGEWVDGTDLANAEVGGSEGLKRLRELRQMGFPIEERKHPDPRRSVHQYRLRPRKVQVSREGKPDQYIDRDRAGVESADAIRRLDRERAASERLIPQGSLRMEFGQRVCRYCQGSGGTVGRPCWSCGGKGVAA